MATATPLNFEPPGPAHDLVVENLRAMGIDPEKVPHAGSGTWEGFQREAQELWDLGLRGEDYVAALGGGRALAEDPPELVALLAELARESTR